MSKRIDILIKSITLLNREFELGETTNDNSVDLVKTILSYFNKSNSDNKLLGGDSTIISDLKHLLKDMIDNPDNYDKHTLIQSLKIILKDKPSLLSVVDKTINVTLDVPSLKRTIISLRNTLNNFYKEEELKNTISKASYQLNTNNIGNDSIVEYVNKLITNLEALTNTTKVKDPGIVDELDISDTEHVARTMDIVKKESTAGGKLICGWKAINKMTSGGFRKGEQWVVCALQHNYKSGFVQSLFAQLSMHNVPELKDKTKKPLNVLISFEDDMNIVTGFLYRYLYYNEHRELPDMNEVTGKEIGEYITKKLSRTGYHIKILRVNPSEWTYKHLFNKILEYEAEGYEIHVVIIDYLSKLPTTGCITSGPMGTDVRDLFNRTRNFFSSKNILNITPHQLSTEANQLIRAGIKGKEFLDEISNKNYYSESKQISQVVDGELYLTKGTINRKWKLFVGRGKHRTPNILDDEYKQTVLSFPKNAPILEDIHEEEEIIIDDTSSSDDIFDEM